MKRTGSASRAPAPVRAPGAGLPHPGRRTFLQGLACGGVLTALGTAPFASIAADRYPVLSGTEFDLRIGAHPVSFTGRTGIGTLINGSLPAPLLRWREGDTVALRVHNELAEDTSIHWHGILLPANMDGVPGLSFRGIPPGGHYQYRFRVRQNGTYWYHSHSGFQEQTGLSGPLVIDPAEAEPFDYDSEHVVFLSDWTDMDPHRLFALLKKEPEYFNYNRRTLADFVRDARRDGFGTALGERLEWARMRMDPTDLADVSGHTYTYLMNGTAPAGNWTGLIRPGERVRLRFINGSAMTYFDIRIPGLTMTAVAADGQYVHPVSCEEFRLGVAETLDVIVEPRGADAFTIFAQAMDRSGYARGTLAVREGLSAPVPELDRVVYLSMADMGHGSLPHASGGHDVDHAGHGEAGNGDDHADHGATDSSEPVDHAAMGHSVPDDTASAASEAHPGHTPSASDAAGRPVAALQSHPASESRNPGVDMQAMMPEPRLADPGVGLRDNGRRVLSYADLRTLFPDPDGREPGRTVEIHLTGHMGRFIWSFDGIRFSDSEPIRLRYGERVRLLLVNDTMMDHPIHLHGMWSDLEDEQDRFHLRKHTVNVAPGTKRATRVTADALGRWAYHCHLLYHMEAGMFREVRVEEHGRTR